MNFQITLLIVSFVAIITMVVVRRNEMQTGKFFFPEKTRKIADKLISDFFLAVARKIGKMKFLIKRFFSGLSKLFLKLIHKIWSFIRRRVDSFFEKIHRNPRDLDNHKGSVSIYWNSISEDIKK